MGSKRIITLYPSEEHLARFTQHFYDKKGNEVSRWVPINWAVTYPTTPTRLEVQVGRPLPHPQSEHLTEEEFHQMEQDDKVKVLDAAAKRVLRRERRVKSAS